MASVTKELRVLDQVIHSLREEQGAAVKGLVLLESAVRDGNGDIVLSENNSSCWVGKVISEVGVFNRDSQLIVEAENSSFKSAYCFELAVEDLNGPELGRAHQSDLVEIREASKGRVFDEEWGTWVRQGYQHGWFNHLSCWVAYESAITNDNVLRLFHSEKVGEHRVGQVELPVEVWNGDILGIFDEEDSGLKWSGALIDSVVDL